MNAHLLITTADDFGASVEVNEAVVSAFQDGILRFASLMVDAPAAQDAVALAKANPGLGVGIHLVLAQESPARWGLRLLHDREERRRLDHLISGQIERFLACGLNPTHLDSHFNAHVHPMVFPVLARLAKHYDIPRVRWPAGELGPCLAYERKSLLPRIALAGVYGALGLAQRRSMRGLNVTRAFGMLRSGLMTEDYVQWLIRHLPEGTTEIYFHPSADPGSQVQECPTPTHATVTELQTLKSPRVRRALEEEHVGLVEAVGAARP